VKDTFYLRYMSQKSDVQIPDEVLERRIHFIRGQKVMLDRDLAELYGVEVKQLKRQVKRNAARFPDDFMFELSKAELENWRSQFGTSNPSIKQGLRYAPYAFTENGVAQLSSVLNSERAIAVNIQIIRLFTRMREMLLTHKDLILELEKLRNSSKKHAGKIQVIFRYLKQMEKRETERVLLAQIAKEKMKARPEAGYKRMGRKKEE